MLNLPQNRNDFIDAASDYLRIRAGIAPPVVHPAAERMADSQPTLRELAAHCCELAAQDPANLRARSAMAQTSGAFAFGISTSDFKKLLDNVVRGAVERAYDVNLDEVRSLCAVRELRDFRPVEIGSGFGVDVDTTPIGELRPVRQVSMSFRQGEQVSLLSYGAKIGVSRQLLVNDDVDALVDVLNQVTAAFARKERSIILKAFDINTQNPTLADGQPMFSAAAGNLIVAGDTVGFSNFGECLVKLATQKVPGSNEVGDLRPRYVVVNPGDELECRAVLRDADMGSVVTVVVTAAMPSNLFAVLADPAKAPVIAAARLSGIQRSVFGELSNPRQGTDDVAEAIVRADFGAAPVSRFGVVLCQA